MLKRLEHGLDNPRSSGGSGPKLEFRVTETARDLAAARLGKNASPGGLSSAVAEVFRTAETLADERTKEEPPRSPVACRAGCAYCCYLRVNVTPPEVIFLAEFVRRTFSATQLEALKMRVRQADNVTHGMTEEAHAEASVPCPLLVDDHCSVYNVRPLECRAYNSMDVAACRRALDDYGASDVPVYLPQYSIFKNAQAGLISAMFGADHPFEVLELTAALRIALEISSRP